jgi:putative DNA primase/helicase
MSSRETQAQYYARRGFKVLPVANVVRGICQCHRKAQCDRPGKHPLIAKGVKAASLDRKQINAWWTTYPYANIGVATGKDSDLLVFDLDPRNGSEDTWKAILKELGNPPQAPKALTGGGGIHYLYKYPAEAVRSDTNGRLLGAGIDVLSDGKYFIAPIGSHASGRTYRWSNDAPLWNAKLVQLSKPWLSKITSSPSGTAEKAQVKGADVGGRNTTLTSVGGALRRAGAEIDTIRSELKAQNAKFSPPLPQTEVEKIVQSVASYPAIIDDVGARIMQLALDRSFANGEHLLFEGDRFWFFMNTHWRQVNTEWVNGEILKAIESGQVQTNKISAASLLNQTRELLKAKLSSLEDRLSLVGNPSRTDCSRDFFGSTGASCRYEVAATTRSCDTELESLYDSILQSGRSPVET